MNTRVLLIVLIVICVFGTPIFPYAHNWGWGWSGSLGSVLLLLLILTLLGVF